MGRSRRGAGKRIRLAIVLAGLILLFASSCGGTDDDAARRLDADDTGATVELAVGDEVVIELESNPTTGFLWKIAALDLRVVSEGEREFEPDDPDADGSGGTLSLRFEAVAAGETTLELAHTGPSSPDDITDRFTVTFVVATE